MIILGKLWAWLKAYWYIPVLLLGAIAAVVLYQDRKRNPLAEIKHELNAIKASTDVKKLQAQLGKERAQQAVEDQYSQELEQLSVRQKKQAVELYDDPAKLAKFLVRAARSPK